MIKVTLLLLSLCLPSLSFSGVCEEKYPPVKTLVKKPIKVAYTATVKIPVKSIGRCAKTEWKKIKKKPWKILTKPFTVWYDCPKTIYKEVKEKRFREEFKEVEEIKKSAKLLKCIAKEKDIRTGIKTAFLLVNPFSGVGANLFIDTIIEDEKAAITTISDHNLDFKTQSFTVINNERALTYQIFFRGKVSMNITQKFKGGEMALSKNLECLHEITQELEWTKPCLVDNRPVHQFTKNPDISFTCDKDFTSKESFKRGLEVGKKGDSLGDHSDCKKINPYLVEKFKTEREKLSNVMKDHASIISNTQFLYINGNQDE